MNLDYLVIALTIFLALCFPISVVAEDSNIEHLDSCRSGRFISAYFQEHLVVPHPYDIRKYYLELNPSLGDGYLRARATIDFESKRNELSEVTFNFVGDWAISNVTVGGMNAAWNHDGEILTVYLPSAKKKGDRVSIGISYEGFPSSDPTMGLSLASFYMDGVYGHTFSQPFQARYWFPCFDEPSDKADEGCEVIVTVPSDTQVASNGLLVSSTVSGNDRVFHWRHSHAIATYLISVAVGQYSVIEWSADGTPILIYAYPYATSQASYDFAGLPVMMLYFSQLFGKYPFEKYGTVVVPSNSGWAMEHQTMTHWSDRIITGDRRYDRVVAHELAHQWWGDSVTLADYREIWLNEGFASYCEVLWSEHTAGAAGRDQVVQNFRQLYLEEDERDRFSIYRTDYDLGRMFSRTTYKKAALVLHMLRWEIGDNAFFKGLKEYYRRHAYGTVTTSDFVSAMEWASNRELDDFFQGWIYGTGYPEYEISSYYDVTGVQLKAFVTVHQAQDDPTLYSMTLPIDPDGSGGMPPERRLVTGKWFQYAVDVPVAGGPAEIEETDRLLMTVSRGDYAPPLIEKVLRSRIAPDATNRVTLLGRNFTPVSRVSLSKNRIEVQSVSVTKSGNKIRLRLSVPEKFKPGPVDLTVINPDGDAFTKSDALRVTKPR